MLSSIVFLLLPLITNCSPLELQPRGSCNADNCLRQLRGTPNNLLASPYCSSYYTSTTTITTVTTIPALGATFPGVKKRTAEGNLMKRTTATPSYVSQCTQAPTALSSGCSCLLGIGAATTTTIVTSTSTLPLPVICSSSNDYGLSPTPLTFNSLPNGQGSSGLGFDVLPGGCCAFCNASPNCFQYYELLDYIAAEPGYVGCSVGILGDVPIEPLGHPTCPLGIVTLTAGVPQTSILYGAGPCATVVPAAPTP